MPYRLYYWDKHHNLLNCWLHVIYTISSAISRLSMLACISQRDISDYLYAFGSSSFLPRSVSRLLAINQELSIYVITGFNNVITITSWLSNFRSASGCQRVSGTPGPYQINSINRTSSGQIGPLRNIKTSRPWSAGSSAPICAMQMCGVRPTGRPVTVTR